MKAVILAFLMYMGLPSGASAAEPINVSMIQLIADPQRFDGQNIRVIGFMRLEFEGNAVYLHREDYERAVLQNGVWIELTDPQIKTSAKLNNGYVIIEGTFSAKERGHLGIWSGSIQKVSRLGSWSVDRRRRPFTRR
jgi:hypothetical protein